MSKVGKLSFKKKQEDKKVPIPASQLEKRRIAQVITDKEELDREAACRIEEAEAEAEVKEGEIPAEDLLMLGRTAKTPAEMQYDLVRLKRMGQKIQNRMDLTYRQKIERFNKKIQKMPEHYDIPKVGPG